MPRSRTRACRSCGQLPAEGTVLSCQGYCESCGIERATEAIRAMVDKQGAQFRKWQENGGARGGPKS